MLDSAIDAPVDGVDEDEYDAPASAIEHDDGDGERAGVYLAALIALAVPSLIVLAFFLPATTPGDSGSRLEGISGGTGLESVDVTNPSGGDAVDVEVAGAGESQEPVATEIGTPATLKADTTDEVSSDDVQIAGPVAVDENEPTGSDARDEAESATTITPTTAAPSSTAPTTAPPETTASPTTIAEDENPSEEPPAFSQRIDIGRIGETTLQFRFASATETRYTATVREGSTVAASASGSAVGGELINEVVQGLTPGTEYTVQVTLDGPPQETSPEVSFRTSGGAEATAPDERAVVLNLRVAEASATRFEVRYESNICANGSFTIREQGGAVVGRNAGQAAGCTTRHLGIPGFWTPPLTPDTTYVITVQVEANGAGQGNGNTATHSLTVTTTS